MAKSLFMFVVIFGRMKSNWSKEMFSSYTNLKYLFSGVRMAPHDATTVLVSSSFVPETGELILPHWQNFEE